jgi:hypothetical protein
MAGALKGKDWYRARLQKFVGEFPGVVGDAMYQAAAPIAEASQAECPVQFGVLRASFYMVKAGTDEDPKVQLGYGTDYAVYVHERVGLNHPVGKAKFLEDPMIAAKTTWLPDVWRRSSALLKARGLK